MDVEGIALGIKAVFTIFHESLNSIKLSRCRKIVEELLKEYQNLEIKLDSLPEDNIESDLQAMNSILVTIQTVLASNICH